MPNDPQLNDDLDVPCKLHDELSAIYGASIEIPTRVNDSIRNIALARLSRAPRHSLFVRIASAAVAAAALIVIAFRLLNPPAPPSSVAITTSVPQDLNGDGRVDILDALILAKQVDAQRASSDARLDLNHDGVVDRKDADAIAMAAVQLRKEITQ